MFCHIAMGHFTQCFLRFKGKMKDNDEKNMKDLYLPFGPWMLGFNLSVTAVFIASAQLRI